MLKGFVLLSVSINLRCQQQVCCYCCAVLRKLYLISAFYT